MAKQKDSKETKEKGINLPILKADFSEFTDEKNTEEKKTESKKKTILPEIDELQTKIDLNEGKAKKKKRIRWGKVISLLIITGSLFVFIFGTFFASSFSSIKSSFANGDQGFWESLWEVGKTTLPGSERVELKGESEGRTNFLLLGNAELGGTDTIIIMSYYHAEKKFVTLSIPRDFYVRDGEWYSGCTAWDMRVNAIYVWAKNAKKQDSRCYDQSKDPVEMVEKFIEEEFQIPIHYWSIINFQGVEALIDELGGIEVDVERTFTDCKFPNKSFGYLPCQTFEAGLQKMDGEKALIYARSRKGNNGEGGDFARSRRQSIVIESILEKTKKEIKAGNVLSVNNIKAYLDILGGSFRTSMKIEEILSFYEIFKENHGENSMESDFYRINWEAGNGIIDYGRSSSGASILTYSDGNIGGTSSYSSSRDKARDQLENLLYEAKYNEIYKADTIVLGNGSNEIKKVYNNLKDKGFSVYYPDYHYSYIGAATNDSVEKVMVFIPDANLKSAFEEMKDTLGFEVEVFGYIPEDKKITSKNQGSDLIFWIESI